MKLKNICFDAILLALLIISAFISIPVMEISFTLQVLIVLIISLLLPLKDGLTIIILYFVMGLIGIPVFSQGGGIAYLTKPSFGYLLGFIFSPLIAHFIKKLPIKLNAIKDVIASIISLAIIYLFGTVYFYFIMKYVNKIDYDIIKIIKICIIPFIIVDLLKVTSAVIIMVPLRKVIKINADDKAYCMEKK